MRRDRNILILLAALMLLAGIMSSVASLSITAAWALEPMPCDIAAFTALQQAMLRDDRRYIAAHVRYPFYLIRADGTGPEINNPRDFLRHYHEIFNRRVRRAVRNQIAAELGKNDRGVIIGHGEMWLEGFYEPDCRHAADDSSPADEGFIITVKQLSNAQYDRLREAEETYRKRRLRQVRAAFRQHAARHPAPVSIARLSGCWKVVATEVIDPHDGYDVFTSLDDHLGAQLMISPRQARWVSGPQACKDMESPIAPCRWPRPETLPLAQRREYALTLDETMSNLGVRAMRARFSQVELHCSNGKIWPNADPPNGKPISENPADMVDHGQSGTFLAITRRSMMMYWDDGILKLKRTGPTCPAAAPETAKKARQ